MEHRIVAQMLTCMDDLSEAVRPPPVGSDERENPDAEEIKQQDEAATLAEAAKGRHVVVLAATNRPDALDSAL
eukprot:scaffold498703_cov47-Prasinocladus_malaysianus.AAC.1